MSLPELDLPSLRDAVAGNGAAFRSRTRLQPAAGAGEKIFPPTFSTPKGTLKYALEDRRVDGQTVRTVLLDSVASQANRIEEALLAGWESKDLDFPVIAVDFTDEHDLAALGRLTTLQTPHRIADALFRDSIDANGVPFRDTEAGKAYTDATVRAATAVYRYCPTALVLGVWDSTGPRGGLGNKFQRALVSEIVGYGAEIGVKTASRIDPAGIQANVDVFHHKDDRDEWTIREEEALRDGKKLVPFSRKNTEGRSKGKPSAVNHSNVAPTIDPLAGGVTFDYALQTTVLSLPALRRLRFPTDVTGRLLDQAARAAGEVAARTALAALALAGVARLRGDGFDLRSRSFLVPEPGGPLELELVMADGRAPAPFSLSSDGAAKLLRGAVAEASAAGFGWQREPVVLKPAPKLVALIRRSRELAAEGAGDESAESP